MNEEYKEDDLEGTDAARKKRAKQTPGQETMEGCGCMNEEEKKGPLNKPMRDSGGNKKFKVYVKDPSTGNVKTVRFGDPNMEIKRDDPNRRKNFRARHNCDNPGPKTKARYWSCRQWRAGAKVEDDFKPTGDFIRESLKDWFGSGGKGGKGGGGWDRYSSTGKRLGKCGDGEKGEAYAACLSSAKAAKLGKKGIANFVKRKRAAQAAAGDPKKGKGESGETKTSKAPTRVETGTRKKTNEDWSEKYKRSIDCDNPKGFSQKAHCQGREKDMKESREQFGRRMLREAYEKGYLEEKNIPTNPELYSRVKAEAKRKFDVYPSAYANAWLVKTYKKRGGGYRKGKGD